MDKFIRCKSIYLQWTVYLMVLLVLIGCKDIKQAKECDYVAISKQLFKYVQLRDTNSMKKLLAFGYEGLEHPAYYWSMNKRFLEPGLDSIKDLNKLELTLKIDENNPIEYAIVNCKLGKDSVDKVTVDILFFHPESPLGCKIQSIEAHLEHMRIRKYDPPRIEPKK